MLYNRSAEKYDILRSARRDTRLPGDRGAIKEDGEEAFADLDGTLIEISWKI